jgi:hypothetical protein
LQKRRIYGEISITSYWNVNLKESLAAIKRGRKWSKIKKDVPNIRLSLAMENNNELFPTLVNLKILACTYKKRGQYYGGS